MNLQENNCGLSLPQMPADAATYWEDRFAKLHETASWKKYVADIQLGDSYLPGAGLRKSIVEIEKQLRQQYQQADIKTVRRPKGQGRMFLAASK